MTSTTAAAPLDLPAAQAPLEAQARLSFSGQGERRIAWRSWGSGALHVVLLHGSAGSWTHFLRNIEPLARHCRVHAPDLPGNGDSGPVALPESLPGMAQQLASGFDEIEPSRPRIVLVGFSFGSLVADEWALLHPQRIDRLVLVRGSFDGSGPGPLAGLVRWKGLSPQDEAQAHRTNLSVLMLRDAARIDAATLALHAYNSRRSSLRPTAFEPTRTPDALHRHPMPVTGLCGEFDVLAAGDVWQQQQAFRQARPQDRHDVIRGAGHWVMYEAAEAFNARLAESLGTG